MTAAPTETPQAPAKDGHGCLPRGYRLREFVIERVLGDGGFGVVYSAIDLRLERRVAIKEYMPSSLARRDTDYSVQMLTSEKHRQAFEIGLRSFINEARLLARFEHPALIKVHQFWQEKGTAYMVMPFYAAPTLRHWVRSRQEPISEAWLRGFLLRAMEAIEVMHAEACLHRDIAPDNILVINDAKPLLLDFGAARRVIGDLRKALTVIVKPGFAPLEQYADTVQLKQGAWSDIYALAAVGHFIITGQAPAPAVSRVLADEVVPLRVRAKGRYSEALLGALDTALAVRPERRPQSIAALRALLLSTQPGEWAPTRLIGSTEAHSLETPAAVAASAAPAPDESAAGNPHALRARPMPTAQRAAQNAPAPAASDAAPPTLTPAPRTLVPPPRTQVRTRQTSADATSLQRRPATRIVDFGTLTQAVRETLSPEKQHSRWVGIAGYAAALLVFGGVLYATTHLVERYVEATVRAGGSAVVVTRSAPAAAPVETPPASPTVTPNASVAPAAAPAAPVSASAAMAPTGALAEGKPSEVTLAPTHIDLPRPAAAVPTPATAGSHATTQPAVKNKIATPAKTAVEQLPRDTGKTGLLAAVPAAASPAVAAPAVAAPAVAAPAVAAPAMATAATRPESAPIRKTRGLDEPVVPLERAADVAHMAKVALVETTPPESAPAAAPVANAVAAPLRAISKPEPQFPATALKEGVREGRVLATLTVNGDGSIGKVDIVESQPRNVFDKEVRKVLAAWRYEAPGQPRHATVEFVFKREE